MSIPSWLCEISFVQSVGRQAGNKSQLPCANKNGNAAKNFTKNISVMPNEDYLNHQSSHKALRCLYCCLNQFISQPFLRNPTCHTSFLSPPLTILGAVRQLAKLNFYAPISFQKTDAHPIDSSIHRFARNKSLGNNSTNCILIISRTCSLIDTPLITPW